MEQTKVKPYKAKIVKNGTAMQVTIPQHIVRYLELNKGDMLQVELTIIDKNGKPQAVAQGNPNNAVFWILSGDRNLRKRVIT